MFLTRLYSLISRCLVVYPWTQRYFGGFGNLYNAEAIMANPKIAAHGIVVLQGLEKALKNMDSIKNTFTALSELHSEKLQVDPGNFQVGVLKQCAATMLVIMLELCFTFPHFFYSS